MSARGGMARMDAPRSERPRSELAVLFDGMALALTARCGGLSRAALDRSLSLAARIDRHHPARRAVEAFSAAWLAGRSDPALVAEAGDTLQRDLLRVLRPAPVDQGRVDIHG